MNKEKALILTKKMNEMLVEINQIYEKARETKQEYDFYQVVEPYVNQTQEVANDWYKSIQSVMKQEFVHFQGERHLQQIVENISTLSVQAFQHTTSYNRFKSYLQSTQFLLRTFERQLSE